MDIADIIKRTEGNEHHLAEALRLYFEHLALAMLTVKADAGDADETEEDRLYDEITEVTERIHRLPATSVAAVRARVAVAYFWAKLGGQIDVDTGLALANIADSFVGTFKAMVDPMFEAVRRDASANLEALYEPSKFTL